MPRKKKEADPRSVHERQRDFLQAYGDTFNVSDAADQARVNRTSHHRWLRKNAKYAAAFAKRRASAGAFLEAEAITRAGEGYLEPVFYQGSECGTVRRYDSGLMQFLLRGMMPEKYGAKTEVTGPQGAPIQAQIKVIFVKPGESA